MFVPVQCLEEICWCVQANGVHIPNTFYQKGAPEHRKCTEYQGKEGLFTVYGMMLKEGRIWGVYKKSTP